MATDSYDVIIIGAGIAGSAVAYQLARQGVAVLVLDAHAPGGGTSSAAAGRAQVSESHRGPHFELVKAGLARLEQLEEELGFGFEWRRLGNLMLIDKEQHWWEWVDQVDYLLAQGIQADMLDQKMLRSAEPLLRAEQFLGAAWCLEGHLNPMKYCRAWASAAERYGAIFVHGAPVVGLEANSGRIFGARTNQADFSAGVVLVTAGAWSGEVLRLAGASLPVQYTHAEAIISESLPPLIRNHVGLADFYETIHNSARAVSVGVAQQQNGTLLITEAVEMSQILHRANSSWGPPGIARDILGLFPDLSNVRVVRSWAAPSPFLPDEQPAIGWIPGFDNLFVGTCFHLTVTTIPIISEIIAGAILEQSEVPILEDFSPARFVQ
jgi:glycine/D-amino acid oxidase-like deaminating enzyme